MRDLLQPPPRRPPVEKPHGQDGAVGKATTVEPETVRESVAGAIPLAVVLALAVFMAAKDGGLAPTIMLPAALFVLALLAVIVIAVPRRLLGAPRLVLAAVGLFAAFTVWSALSIAWAQAKGDAWDGSNRTFLYLLVLTSIALWPTSPRAVWIVALSFVVAVATLGVVTVVQLIQTTDVESLTINGRLSAPIGYPNANAAFFMLTLWLAVGLASRAWLPWVVRGVSCGLAVVLAGLSVLAASRGSVFTLPVIVITYLLIVPGRLRSIVTLLLIGVGVAPIVHPALQVYRSSPEQIPAAARHALVFILASGAVVASVAMIIAAVDERTSFRPTLVRATGIVVVCLALGGFAVTAIATHPWNRLDTAWHDFRYTGEPDGATHYGGLGSNRYDFWRVSLGQFRAHPFAGIGTDNFLVPYVRQRTSPEEPLYAHSLWVDLLSQTGLIGTILFTGFVATAAWVVARIRKPRERELAGVAFAAFSVWIWHGLVDWLWEMPALGVAALGCLGVALSLARTASPDSPPRRYVRIASALCAAALLVSGATFALPWLAERDVQRAAAIWGDDANGAFRLLDRAHRLNPATDRADVVAGAIASRLGRFELMRARFSRATRRAPYDWYAFLELGIANSLTGNRPEAAAAFQRALFLNPREKITQEVVQTFRARGRIDPAAIDQKFLEAGPCAVAAQAVESLYLTRVDRRRCSCQPEWERRWTASVCEWGSERYETRYLWACTCLRDRLRSACFRRWEQLFAYRVRPCGDQGAEGGQQGPRSGQRCK
jgi:O-antigen ligase